MFTDEARFGRMNRPRPCWAPAGIRPEVALQLIREYIYLYGAVSPKDGMLRLPDHADVEYGVLPDIPQRRVAKVCQAGHPVGSRWRSQPSLRRARGSRQHLAALPATLLARAQSKGKPLG